MSDYIIICDSACDLSNELRSKYDIEYVPGHIKLPNGKEELTLCEWTYMTHDEFYKELKKNPDGFSTSPASPEEYKQAFGKALAEGKDVLALSISTALSGTYKFMNMAKAELEKEYPDRKVIIIDTLRYSTGFGLLAVRASMLRAEGKSIDEVSTWVEENKCTLHQMGFLDDLSFVASKGRISKPKAFMGQLIGIKPMGDFDYNGLTTVIGKCKGDKAAIENTIKYMQKTIVDAENQLIFVASTNRDKQAAELKKRIEETFKPKEVIMNEVYPQDGVNVGPGLMVAYYFGKPISQGLEEEKQIITEILNSK